MRGWVLYVRRSIVGWTIWPCPLPMCERGGRRTVQARTARSCAGVSWLHGERVCQSRLDVWRDTRLKISTARMRNWSELRKHLHLCFRMSSADCGWFVVVSTEPCRAQPRSYTHLPNRPEVIRAHAHSPEAALKEIGDSDMVT